ncbi:hypothetical protein L596_012490 [Steinernema carpocapsae]|uniref:Uncharacterized protein n=1 Tax=Steinernema carpocapsae TaxID=34508 RepID=A0A4U5NXU2_STECR|nr:hypothetical protein L596_012490 [Steinernema carpocapsae]
MTRNRPVVRDESALNDSAPELSGLALFFRTTLYTSSPPPPEDLLSPFIPSLPPRRPVAVCSESTPYSTPGATPVILGSALAFDRSVLQIPPLEYLP